MTSKLSIFPTRFEESCVGKTFTASKLKSEYTMLVNYHTKVVIDVINSRFSRKKTITMNGEVVNKFHKTNTTELQHTWTYLVDGQTIEFSVGPNKDSTGTNLSINGVDFFDCVYAVDADGDDPIKMFAKGANTVMTFKVPPKAGSVGITVKPTVRETLPSLAVFDGSQSRSSVAAEPPKRPAAPSKPAAPVKLFPNAGATHLPKRLLGNVSPSQYAAFEDDDEQAPTKAREDLIQL